MNLYVWVLAIALAVAALANWRAVARGQREIETLAKPAFMVLLIALAWLMHADAVSYGQFLLAGLVLSLIGDVLLLGDSDVHFLGGLVAFLLGHLAYIAAFRRVPGDGPIWIGVLLVVLAVGVVLWLRLVPRLRDDDDPGKALAPRQRITLLHVHYHRFAGFQPRGHAYPVRKAAVAPQPHGRLAGFNDQEGRFVVGGHGAKTRRLLDFHPYTSPLFRSAR